MLGVQVSMDALTVSMAEVEKQPSTSPPPPSPADTTTSGKQRRSTGPPNDCCHTCRARKVKCTGNPGDGPCHNCSRLELPCNFVDVGIDQERVSRTTPSRLHTEAGTPRKRAQRACQSCHAHKTKCSGDIPRCKRCEEADLKCEYAPAKRKFSTVPHQESKPKPAPRPDIAVSRPATYHDVSLLPKRASPVHEDSETDDLAAHNRLLGRDVVLRHMNAWFELLHPLQSYGFLHSPSIYRDIEEGTFPSTLGAAVCAVTGFFLASDAEGRAFADRCNLWVKIHISRTAGILTQERLSLLVLGCLYGLMVGDWPRVWEYIAVASHLVTAMQYNWDRTSGSFVEQESIRRLTWQVFILHRILAGGFDEHLTLREDNMFLSLPCNEQAFQANRSVTTERLDQRPRTMQKQAEPSIYALHARLMATRHHILGVTKKYASKPTSHPRTHRVEPSMVMEDVNRLQFEMDRISESIPGTLQLSHGNIKHQYTTTDWPAFLMLHTWIFQLHVDLYRFALPGIRERATDELFHVLPQDFLVRAQFQAIAFAVVLARFWETALDLMAHQPYSALIDLVAADHILPTCVIQSTKILLVARQYQRLFDLRSNSTVPPFRNEAVNDAALATLVESNMALLDTYCRVMPKVDEMARDLKEAVANFSFRPNADIDKPAMIGMPFVQTPENVRLPGPHYVLENILLDQEKDDEVRRQRSASIAEEYFNRRKAGQGRPLYYDATSSFPADKQLEYVLGPPEIPFVLSQARSGAAGGHSSTMPLLMSSGLPVPSHPQDMYNHHHHHQHQPDAGMSDPGFHASPPQLLSSYATILPPGPGSRIVGEQQQQHDLSTPGGVQSSPQHSYDPTNSAAANQLFSIPGPSPLVDPGFTLPSHHQQPIEQLFMDPGFTAQPDGSPEQHHAMHTLPQHDMPYRGYLPR
ncbi:hypothetical protein QBC46DRAFT_434535 [Diplogelasinospora grovesii]|uniref:Zn(2)-C6 fungal-type domain-containing protein n=1 Tax=Diplogelasinospora grovesii TaxID=303347 RepID=A0AAN6NA11_9PEZI|nr:hypothetical protein QBC46DRAFT_434535 [Diplogelasinospora grovesii]